MIRLVGSVLNGIASARVFFRRSEGDTTLCESKSLSGAILSINWTLAEAYFSPDQMRQVSIRVATCLSHVDDINTAARYTADGIVVRPVKTDPNWLFIRRRPPQTSDTYILDCVVRWQEVVYLRHLTCSSSIILLTISRIPRCLPLARSTRH